MNLYKLIEQSSEIEDQLGPMAKVFIRNEDDELVEAYHVTTESDGEGLYIVVVE